MTEKADCIALPLVHGSRIRKYDTKMLEYSFQIPWLRRVVLIQACSSSVELLLAIDGDAKGKFM